MFRTAQKSEHMVLERHQEKVQYLRLSLTYYNELVKLFTMMKTMMKESQQAETRPPELLAQLDEFIESRSSQFKQRIKTVQGKLKELLK